MTYPHIGEIKMGYFSKFNKGRKFDFDTTGFEYRSLSELYNENGANQVYPLTAMYVNSKSNFGVAPVFATTDCFVNIPSHMVDVVNQILADEEAIKAINEGKIGFVIYPYIQKKFNKTCYGVNFVDI